MSFKVINHNTAQEQLAKNPSCVVVDVRDQDSYLAGHIPGAWHLSMDSLVDFCQQNDKNQSMLVYCYHGISSRAVAQHLIDHGFVDVCSLEGGFEVWREHHPVETSGA